MISGLPIRRVIGFSRILEREHAGELTAEGDRDLLRVALENLLENTV